MIRIITLALFIFIQISAKAQLNAKLRNGEFDSGTTGWRTSGNVFSDEKCFKSQELDGEAKAPKSLRLENTDAKVWTGATQIIEVQPGAVYRVSGWAKIKDAGDSRFVFECFKKDGRKTVRVKRPIYMFVHVKGNRDWFKRERYVQIPEGTRFAKVSLGVRDGSGKKSYAWFDKIEVEKSFSPPPRIDRGKWMAAAKKLYGEAMQAPAMNDKVVYYDKKHEFFWVKEPERIKIYLENNGFKTLDAKELKTWMQKKIKSGADGSVCVLTTGAAPEEIVETFKTPDVTMKQYLYAGGRIVWPGNIPLHNVTSNTRNAMRWPIKQRTVRSAILGFENAKYNQHVKVKITAEGKKWGLRARHETPQRLTEDKGVTLSLSKSDKKDESGTFFKNYNIKFPYSGFIRYRADQTDASNNQELQDIYCLALFRGKPIKAPKNFPAVVVEKLSFAMPVTNFYQGSDVPMTLKCAAGISSPVTVTLTENKHVVFKQSFALKPEIKALLPTAKLKCGNYELTAVSGKETCIETIKFLPVKSGKLPIALYSANGSTMYKRNMIASTIAGKLGDCGYLANNSAAVLMNNIAFGHGLKLLPRSYAHNYLIRSKLPGDREMRLKDGSIPKYHYGKRSSSPCFLNEANRKFAAEHLVKDLELMKKFPGYKKRMLCYDDGAMFGEPGKSMIACYCDTCKAAFKKKTGHDAPVTPDPAVLKNGGIIPDSNAWIQWMRFRSKDVFGDTFGYLDDNAVKKVAPDVKFCHILGDPNMTFDPQWALNPPDEFGKTSMIVYYYYPHVARPSYMHLPFAAKAVAGNRDKDLWPTGQSTDYRGYVSNPHTMAIMIRNQFYCMIAGGAKGTIWYDYNSLPGTEPWDEFGKLANFANKFGPLVQKWRKQPGRIAILMSYTNASFKWALSEMTRYCQGLDILYLECLKNNVPVDFISDGEVKSGILKNYRGLVVFDNDYMPAGVAEKIKQYIRDNGKVIVDKNSKVKFSGAHNGLDMAYLKKCAGMVPLTVNGGNKVVWTEFTLDNGRYFMLVSLDLNKTVKCNAAFNNLKSGETVINLSEGKAVNSQVALEIAPGGACLMAVLPNRVKAVKIAGPANFSYGKPVKAGIEITGPDGKVIDAGIPLRIVVSNKGGKVFSDYVLAEKGRYKLSYPVGINCKYSSLNLTATELATGTKQNITLKLK